MGDYIGIDALPNLVALAWTGNGPSLRTSGRRRWGR